jgi:hypothetical protein
MNYKIPGVASLMLMFAAVLVATYQMYTVSVFLGTAFIIAITFSLVNMLYFYCRKCPHAASNTCRHVIIGWIVVKLFKTTAPTKYSTKEMLLSMLPIVTVILVSQYWLIQNDKLFVVFWILMIEAVVIIRVLVCGECGNFNCVLCKNKNCIK